MSVEKMQLAVGRAPDLGLGSVVYLRSERSEGIPEFGRPSSIEPVELVVGSHELGPWMAENLPARERSFVDDNGAQS